MPSFTEIFDLFETSLKSGSGFHYLVEGESGSGKSSLVKKFRQRVENYPNYVYVHVVFCKTLIGKNDKKLT